jgi:predicted nucleic acid-binding Zn ribbon protein
MQHHCPICGNPILRHDIVCSACRERIEAREPTRRAGVLHAWGRGLMLFLAVFLFLKGAYATLIPKGYESFVASLGLPSRDAVALHWNAAFVLLAALLYAIAWAGGYLGQAWGTLVCIGGLVIFVIGQIIAQFVLGHEDGSLPRSVALFVFWVSVPIFQFVSLMLGRSHAEEAARDDRAAGEAAQTSEE